MTNNDIINEIRGTLRLLMVATISLYLALAGVFLYTYTDSVNKRHDLQVLAVKENTALCKLRGDLKQRVDRDTKSLAQSKAFLDQHPNGALGFTHAQIQKSIGDDELNVSNERRTIDALSDLQCPL